MDEENSARLADQQRIIDAVRGVTNSDVDAVFGMMNATVALVAQQYPPRLTPERRAKIKALYPPATNELMDERAMSAKGVEWLFSITLTQMAIALDYSPESAVNKYVEADDPRRSPTVKSLRDHLDLSTKIAKDQGLSSFGATAAVVHHAIGAAHRAGVNPQQLLRLLLEAMTRLMPA